MGYSTFETNAKASMAKDYTTDHNPTYLYLADLHCPFPAWISESPVPENGTFEKKASTAFADPKNRLLPITDRLSTFYSALNVMAKSEEFSDAAMDRVKSACVTYGIEADVLPYAGLFLDRLEKEANAGKNTSCKFAIDTELNGSRIQLLPINDAMDVVSSASDLLKMAGERRIHYLQLLPACKEIYKAAADLGIQDRLPRLISEISTERMADFEKAAKLIKNRENSAKNNKDGVKELGKREYEDVITKGASGDYSPEECIEKIAAVDEFLQIPYRYRTALGVPLPHEIIANDAAWSDIEKTAADHLLVDDVVIPLQAVQKVSDTAADFRLSKQAAAEFKIYRDETDARELSLKVSEWNSLDKGTLLKCILDADAKQ